MKHTIDNQIEHVVEKDQYKIFDVSDNGDSQITTFDLGADIVIVCHNQSMRRTGLCRSQTGDEINSFLQEMAEGSDISKEAPPALQVRLVGGLTDDLTSMDNLKKTLSALLEFEDGRDNFNILSADILEKPHPESFAVMVRDGSLCEIEGMF